MSQPGEAPHPEVNRMPPPPAIRNERFPVGDVGVILPLHRLIFLEYEQRQLRMAEQAWRDAVDATL